MHASISMKSESLLLHGGDELCYERAVDVLFFITKRSDMICLHDRLSDMCA